MTRHADQGAPHYDASYYQRVYAGFDDVSFSRRWAAGCLAVMGVPDREYGAVLEFGAGLGQNLAMIRAVEKWAVDVSPQSRLVCESLGFVWRDGLAAVPDDAFDLILAHHSLEHVDSPHEVLSGLRRKLRRGGELFVVVPIETGELPSTLAEFDSHRHLFAWTPLTLKNLLLATGWRIRRLDVHSGRWFVRSLPLLGAGATTFAGVRKLVTRLLPMRSGEIIAVCAPRSVET